MQLFASYRSRATRNIWLINELGIDVEIVPVLQAYRLTEPKAPDAPLNTHSESFLAVSPAGTIPVLKDGDLVLSESLAINLYLSRKAGGPLAPKDAAEDAQMMQWALYGMTSIEPSALALMSVYAEHRADTPEGHEEALHHKVKLHRPLKVLNHHLDTSAGHMVGGRFTVADINMAEIVRYAHLHPTLISEFPAIEAWLKACQARPAFNEMWERRTAEPV